MAIIRPMRASDFKECAGEITSTISSTNSMTGNSVESVEIFGHKVKNPIMENVEIYNRSAMISLAMPVVNFFLAGLNCRVLDCILGIQDVAKIASGQRIYNLSTGEEIPISNCSEYKYDEDTLIGGEYIEYLINNLDVDKEINKILTGIVEKAVHKNHRKADANLVCEVVEDEGQFNIFGRYYLNFIADTFAYEQSGTTKEEVVNKDGIITNIDERIKEEINAYNSRLTYLHTIKEKGKDVLLGQIMHRVSVLPIGYRERFMDKIDNLTEAYDALVRVNEDMKNKLLMRDVMLDTVRLTYLDLVNAIKNLMIINMNPKAHEDYKPIFECLHGKTGFIREKMQGARIDYSGRSVIIVDPEMSVDTIGVPETMLEKLLELDIIKNYETNSKNKSGIMRAGKSKKRKELMQKIVQNRYAMTGRQPTLYNLGIRAFKIKPVKQNAIVINPTSTVAFNADFDGDQMHLEVATSKEANDELANLMSSTNNIFLPRNGECHIAPRQEMIHGLWKAFRETEGRNPSRHYNIPATQDGYDQVYNGVCDNTMNIYDTVTIAGKTETAGKVAVRACLKSVYRDVRMGVTPITTDSHVPEKDLSEKFFKELNKYIGLQNKQDFIYTVDRTVKLGFAVTNIFPPSIPIVNYPDVSELIDKFDEDTKKREEYYNIGLEPEIAYSLYYAQEYGKLEKAVKKAIVAGLNPRDGYLEMKNSGARGNDANLMQLFGLKGRVMKNNVEAFNAIIEHSHAEGLSGLEHFITGYGGREGLIDKSIQTYGPGYQSRKISHVTSPYWLKTKDCGTDDGILLDYDFMIQFLGDKVTDNDVANNKYVRDLTTKMMVGRFLAGEDNLIEDLRQAEAIYQQRIASVDEHGVLTKKAGIKMRSPLTCKCPVCVKCYGRDLSTNKLAIVGTPVGALASGTIGEPGTQLIMKNFQSGGIAGVKNLTSSFKVLETYTHLTDQYKPNIPINYDYIAPDSGKIETISRGDGTKLLRIMKPTSDGKKMKNVLGNTKVVMYEDVKLKEYVEKGETVQLRKGSMNMPELIKFKGEEYAKKYLAVYLYNIYFSQSFVDLKYFELLVLGMSFKLCKKGNDYFKPGLFYMISEYYDHDHTGCEFYDTLKGISKVPLYRNDVFSTIFLENIVAGISRSIILSGRDEMKLPITRYSFGLKLPFGASVPGYVGNRGNL